MKLYADTRTISLLVGLVILTLLLPSVVSASIATYPLKYINSTRYLPFSDTNLPSPGLNVSIITTPGEFEAASFIIKPSVGTSGIRITSSDLRDGAGHTIPSEATDIRTVKVWYQAEGYVTEKSGWSMRYKDFALKTPILTPELLLKNDSLVLTNYKTQKSYVWVKNKTFEGYFLMDNTTRVPSDFSLYDNATSTGNLQPFSLLPKENKQIWITTHVPAGQAAGNYTGTITISAQNTTSVVMNFSIRVLPFTLRKSTLIQSIWYTSVLGTVTNPIGSYYSKSEDQMRIELQDMYDHGIMYPTWTYGESQVPTDQEKFFTEQIFKMRNDIGFPKDKIYIQGLLDTQNSYTGYRISLSQAAANVIYWRNHTETWGYEDTYFTGEDEAGTAKLVLLQPYWDVIHRNGGKTLQAGYHPYLAPYISKIDNGNLAYGLDSTQASLWHAQNHTVLNYANPQTGVEDPEIFRENYGYALWVSGYDGAMTFAYQRGFNHTWNDFDDPKLRDEVFAYPKTDGVIDTIEWEGYREGIDDTRYADTLSHITGNRTEATTIINAGIAAGLDMSEIRVALINRINYYIGSVKPVASFTCSPISGSSPLSVQFTDSSSITPTSWAWNFGDGNFTGNTTQSPQHTYTTAGTYTAKLTVCNAVGCNTTVPGTTITVKAGPTPVAKFTTNVTSGNVPFSVKFTDLSTGTSLNKWNWSFGDGSWYNTTIASQKNATHTYSGAGTYTAKLTVCNASGCTTTIPGTSITGRTPTTSITLTSPNGGADWKLGSTQTITWDYIGNPGSAVKIDLMKNGIFYQSITASTSIGSAGSGSYLWNSKTTSKPGTDYKIRVTSTSNLIYNDTSNANFTLSAAGVLPVLAVSASPASVIAGTPTAVDFIVKDQTSGEVINGATVSLSGVATGSGETGPDGIATISVNAGTAGTITATATMTGYTDGVTTITATAVPGVTSITITSPDGVESWKQGSTQTITWSYAGNPGSTVKIELIKGGVLYQLLIPGTSIGSAGSGSYPWTIRTITKPGTDYKIRVTSTSNSSYNDTSNANFAIN